MISASCIANHIGQSGVFESEQEHIMPESQVQYDG